MDKDDLHNLIYEYLKTERLMTLATNGDHIWAANLYYVVDNDLNLYFLSKNAREHCQHIETDPFVAVGIADSSQPFAPGQKGIQLYGKAEKVNILSKLKIMTEMWNTVIADTPTAEKLNPKSLLDGAASSVYKINPVRIKYFNTELWPEDQIRVWK